jgi:hypothetical protein
MGAVLAGSVRGTAVLDRHLQGCRALTIRGESYRFREKRVRPNQAAHRPRKGPIPDGV